MGSLRVKQMCDVINRDTEPYTELFKDKTITIPAGGSVRMTRSEAVQFCGTHPGFDTQRGRDRIKMLDLRFLPINTSKADEEFVSPRDGKKFETQEELDRHLETFADEVFKDEEFEELEEEKTQELQGNMVKCPLCGKAVKGRLGLEMHLRNKSCK